MEFWLIDFTGFVYFSEASFFNIFFVKGGGDKEKSKFINKNIKGIKKKYSKQQNNTFDKQKPYL